MNEIAKKLLNILVEEVSPSDTPVKSYSLGTKVWPIVGTLCYHMNLCECLITSYPGLPMGELQATSVLLATLLRCNVNPGLPLWSFC